MIAAEWILLPFHDKIISKSNKTKIGYWHDLEIIIMIQIFTVISIGYKLS